MFCHYISIRSHVLQADSEETFQVWIQAIQDEIGAAMQLMLGSRSSSGHSLVSSDSSPRSNAKDSTNSVHYSTDSSASSKSVHFNIRCLVNEKKNKHILRFFFVNRESMKDNKMLADILAVAGNDRCCDCSAENPEWASINLGITLCIGKSPFFSLK